MVQASKFSKVVTNNKNNIKNMKNLLEEMANAPTKGNQDKPSVWFKWSKDLDNQTLTGFIVKDAKCEGFFHRFEKQNEAENKSEIHEDGSNGAKKVYYIQLLCIKSPNPTDIEQVRVVKLTPNLMKELAAQCQGDEDLGIDTLDPYAEGAEVLIQITREGKKLNTKYSIQVLRNAKAKKPKLFVEIEDCAKLLGIDEQLQ